MPLRLSIKKMERKHFTTFWGARYKVSPRFVRKALGDGKKLIYLSPMQTRPEYYLIRVDSSWSISNYDENCIADHIEEIYEAVESEYGYYHDGHSSEYDHSDGEYPGWPVFWDEGSSWSEADPKIYRYGGMEKAK